MTSIPDVVGTPLARARQLMGDAGVAITGVQTLDTPNDWNPRGPASALQSEPYVIIQHPADDGRAVDLTVVNAWLPPDH